MGDAGGNEYPNKCVVFYDDHDARIIGYVLYHLEADGSVFVSYLGTHPEYRGQDLKIAPRLLQWVQTDGAETPREMKLVAYFNAPRLVRFYRRRGFTKRITDEKVMMSGTQIVNGRKPKRLVPMTCVDLISID